MYLKSCWKAIVVVFTLCLLALPATSQATYDSLYANSADAVFTNNLWTAGGEYTLTGADLAYHWIYDAGGVRVDYYTADYGTYTTEWLTYTNANNGGLESWLYSAATDGSYSTAEETYDYANFSLDYTLYDDASTHIMDYDFDSVDYSYAGWFDYYSYEETQASGYHELDQGFDSKALRWDYSLTDDPSEAQTYESKYMFDPINGERSSEWHWKSTKTGSYSDYAESGTITATFIDSGLNSYWNYDWDMQTGTESSFSADYSSFFSSFWENHYTVEGNTYYSTWDWKITDSGYYGKGTDWQNDIDDSGETTSESFITDGYGANVFVTSYYKYMQDYDWVDSSFSMTYTDTGSYYKSKHFDFNGAYDESYDWYQSFSTQCGSREEWSSYTLDKDQLYYNKQMEKDSNDFTGYTYNFSSEEFRDYRGESSKYYGSGTYDSESSGYDPAVQRNWLNKTSNEYYKGFYQRRTREYNYNEWKLADSDESYLSWYDRKRDGATNNTLTYETMWHQVKSDTGSDNWNYRFEDYTGANNTTFDEWHHKNTYTGAYEDSHEFQVQNVSYEYATKGQDLDFYWDEMEAIDYVAQTHKASRYNKTLASGFQYWSQSYNDASDNWWHMRLYNPTGTAWIGNKTAWDGAAYDLYYYSAWPDDFFLVEDQSVLPGFMPGDPGSWSIGWL